MHESELQIGDILFFMNASGFPDHVAIYAGLRDDTHFITHAVSDPYFSIMTTRLKPDIRPYQVYRCKDTSLALQTATRMRIWAEHQIPFSIEKHDLHLTLMDLPKLCHPKTGGTEQANLAASSFASHFYRYIEYAAHPQMPEFPHQDKPLEGMFCSEAITAALNVETLKQMNAVKSLAEMEIDWISDRIDSSYIKAWASKAPSSQQPSAQYLAYQAGLQAENEYPFGELPSNSQRGSDGPFLPSIAAWRYNYYGPIENFISRYLSDEKFVLPLDSKITTPFAMLAYFAQHPNHWLDCGKLDPEPVEYPLADLELKKQEWIDYVTKLFNDAKEKKEDILANCLLHPEIPFTFKIPSPVKRPRSLSVDSTSNTLLSPSSRSQIEKYNGVVAYTSPQKPTVSPQQNTVVRAIPFPSLGDDEVFYDSNKLLTAYKTSIKRQLDFDNVPEDDEMLRKEFASQLGFK
ncbi:hypothetical protein [Candidatus Berkiella aquae]|uniref:C40 family peptidase n=1 Tax=Candidatus Berkiella aquae TaxID=295108 RepID=A0A0Q9YYJ2_9GAMM|nr:hypothetical protein [Candidatus Berkiella aquae]MCS5712729.1 C40 family peptidase [Candidatus Berkiella aquae]